MVRGRVSIMIVGFLAGCTSSSGLADPPARPVKAGTGEHLFGSILDWPEGKCEHSRVVGA